MKGKLFEEIMDAVVNGETKEVVSLVNKAMSNNIAAGEILNNALIAGMNEVGELFKDGEMLSLKYSYLQRRSRQELK